MARLREKSQDIYHRLEILNYAQGVPKYLYRVPIGALFDIYAEQSDQDTFYRAREKLHQAAEEANIEATGEDYLFLDIPEELGVYWKSLRAELTPYLHSFWESCLREVNPSIIELQAKYTEVSTRLREKNTQRSLPPYLYYVDVEWLCRIYYGLARKVVTRNRARFNSLIEVLKERVEELWFDIIDTATNYTRDVFSVGSNTTTTAPTNLTENSDTEVEAELDPFPGTLAFPTLDNFDLDDASSEDNAPELRNTVSNPGNLNEASTANDNRPNGPGDKILGIPPVLDIPTRIRRERRAIPPRRKGNYRRRSRFTPYYLGKNYRHWETIERMVVESLIGNDTLTLEEALEAIFGITHEEREVYWQT
ncbi:hypothetical protein TEQG_03082 [Trichophyton equinum CBS 127.97]|uniref:Uncharacterized protein n=1 Tax=Trichophyton equinum (strain ATCC MYA-4606 / CBS 127.97) TaxID=559882 RepID=F2PQ80_TRIEC|nr:hypothetical protein TEQG_03082 [Trichophyton equinum CBS 127.97]